MIGCYQRKRGLCLWRNVVALFANMQSDFQTREGVKMGYELSEEDVKKVLDIESFRHLSKAKVIGFISQIPGMNTDLAKKIIDRIPDFVDFLANMVESLKSTSESVLRANSESQKSADEMDQQILNCFEKQLEKADTPEERSSIYDKMLTVSARKSARDTENKSFLKNITKINSSIIGTSIVLTAAILGVNIKGAKIPRLKS
ncbi:MAG: hypothetical protein LBT59_17520 [Clostridiales bacterium]|jgi:hypothetical protein|nr:hypothetical protein [Clostridiales bacterium]